MKGTASVGLLTGVLALAACGQQVTAPSSAVVSPDEAGSPEAQRVAAIRSNLADLRQVEAAIRRGELPALVGLGGQPIDLGAEIARMEREATDPAFRLDTLTAEDALSAQAAATKTVYQQIVRLSLASFTSQRSANRARYPGFDWRTDGCSMPIKNLNIWLGYNKFFYRSCVHHDFGYANARKYGSLLNEVWRAAVDSKFLLDMNGQCGVVNVACKAAATAFYSAVRVGGVTTGGFYP